MSLRDELILKISEETNCKDLMIRDKRFGAIQIHKIFQQVTGEKPQPMKGQGWHKKKICDEINYNPRKEFGNGKTRLPADGMKQLLTYLQQQS